MRTSARTLFIACLVAAPVSRSASQANPYTRVVQAFTSSTRLDREPDPRCQLVQQSGVPVPTPIAVASHCDVDTSTLGSASTGGGTTSPYDGGVFRLGAAAMAGNNLLSASASASGTFAPQARGNAQGAALAYDFVTISNPQDIFRIAVVASVAHSASAGSDVNDVALGIGVLSAYSVDANSGALSDNRLSVVARYDGAGADAGFTTSIDSATAPGPVAACSPRCLPSRWISWAAT